MRDPHTRTVALVPEQKLSESILDFAAPLLDRLGPVPAPEEARRALELAISIWNLHVMAGPLWGEPQHLAEGRKAMCSELAPPELTTTFEVLSERRRTQSNDDPRCVGKWSFEPTKSGRYSLVCKARLPDGVVPHVPPLAKSRVAIGGKFLDEVRIRLSKTSFLSFPVENHRGEVGSDGVVTIHAKTPTVVALFAEGLLKPVGGAPVEILVGRAKLGPMVLVEVRCAERNLHHDIIVLLFRPANAAVGV